MHAALAEAVSSNLDLPVGKERVADRRPPGLTPFDTLLQATEPVGGILKTPRQRMISATAPLLADTATMFAPRESRMDADFEEGEEKRIDQGDDDAGWRPASESGVTSEAARAHPAPDKSLAATDADEESVTATSGDEPPSEAEKKHDGDPARLETSLLINVQTVPPTVDNPDGMLVVSAAQSYSAEQRDAIGQAPSPSPPEPIPSRGANERVSATVTGQTPDGLSSRPSSLLVPQAVLADIIDAPAGGGSATVTTPSSSAITSPAASGRAASPAATAAELVGGVGQATKPTEAPTQSSASLTQAPGDATQPSPIAVAAATGTDDTGGDDLSRRGHGFPDVGGGHVSIGARDSHGDRSLSAKAVATQVAVHVGKAAKSGLTRIDIALEPASLGKVEVRLDFERDGKISALFLADSREALEALRADARTLERALAEAGVKTDSGSLDFGLREHGAGSGRAFSGGPAPGGAGSEAAADASETESPPHVEPPAPSSGERRLDIRA